MLFVFDVYALGDEMYMRVWSFKTAVIKDSKCSRLARCLSSSIVAGGHDWPDFSTDRADKVKSSTSPL